MRWAGEPGKIEDEKHQLHPRHSFAEWKELVHGRGAAWSTVELDSAREFRAALYIEVEALAPIRAALEGWPRVVPERTTFYGAREIIVRDPASNMVSFASREA